MRNTILGCRIISFLMLLTLILHSKMAVVLFQLVSQPQDTFNHLKDALLYFIFTQALFVIFNLVAAIGLFSVKQWGFIVGYLAIIFSTLVGASYIPIISSIFNKFSLFQPSIIPVLIVNTIILFHLISLNISYRKNRE